MGTVWVREFTGGLDVRRLPETSSGGTLAYAVDGHINRGGEFEQRAAFVEEYNLPPTATKGFAQAPDGLYVFGHQASRPSGLDAAIQYQQLANPAGAALVNVPFATLYGGKLAVIATFSDDTTFMFYDGAIIDDVNAPPNATDSGTPTALLTAKQKLWASSGPFAFSSAVADPTDFGAGSGAGDSVKDLSTHAEGSEIVTGIGAYGEYLAFFSRNVIQIWYIDPDPDLDRQAQVLNNTGTLAPRSVTQFGDGDIFYLDRGGIRSLRARDSSNSAATTDIGSAIDPLIRDVLDGLTDAEKARAKGIIEPREGRFWLVLDDTIYVLSYFTATKVSAWTTYRPGFAIDHIFVKDDVVWLRSGDTVYSYGGTGAPVYSDDVQAEFWLPYLDGDAPAKLKHMEAIDAAVRGTWEVRLATEPNDTSASDLLARLSSTSYGASRVPCMAQATHMSLRFRCTAARSATQPALVSSAIMIFDRDPEEDG